MDFTIFLDGAVWASSARRTSLAVGERREPGLGSPNCAGWMFGAESADVMVVSPVC